MPRGTKDIQEAVKNVQQLRDQLRKLKQELEQELRKATEQEQKKS